MSEALDASYLFRWMEEKGVTFAANCLVTPDGISCKQCYRPLDIVDEDLGSRTCRCGAATVLERRGR